MFPIRIDGAVHGCSFSRSIFSAKRIYLAFMRIKDKQRPAELLLLYVLLPLLLAVPVPAVIRLVLGLLGVIYVIIISRKNRFFSFRGSSAGIKVQELYFLVAKFVLIALITYSIVSIAYPKQLFLPIRMDPWQFIIICGVYTLASVVPQSFIYRYFFFRRYHRLFPNDKVFLFVNGLLFSLAHLFFYNELVLLMTLIGGWTFCHTYLRTRSLGFSILEHALYGCWIYAIGLGGILGFPD